MTDGGDLSGATEVGRDLVNVKVDELLDSCPATSETRTFLKAQFEAGLAWVHFPVGLGGLGVEWTLQRIVRDRLENAGAPHGDLIQSHFAYSLAAPTLLVHGTDDQKARYLLPLFTGEQRWCQLWSEPNAGSDLAGVACRAVPNGDAWTINGQKVWTSGAAKSDIGMLVARSNPDVPKHRGITYFLVDMHAPGVDVRPLRQITGDAEFSEVFLTDVQVPDRDRIGDVGAGWSVVVTTLMNERVMLTGRGFHRPIDAALELCRSRQVDDPLITDRLVQLWIRERAISELGAHVAVMAEMGVPGPQGSAGKLAQGELNQATYELCLDILGDESLHYESYDMKEWHLGDEYDPGDVRQRYLRSRGNTIEGGTSEIMRNILGERVLGLPADIRVDKDLRWAEVPRG
ncbi:MAG: acyl-CoA dehydrogenase family protein [Acidimicrobiales bacterium]